MKSARSGEARWLAVAAPLVAAVLRLDLHETQRGTAVLQTGELGLSLPPSLAAPERDTAIVLRYLPDPAGGAGRYVGIELPVDRSDPDAPRLRAHLRS
jgi:hypothetical protein